MPQIQYYKGCEPGSPTRPKMEVVQLYRRDAVITALAAFRVQMELALGDRIQDDTTGGLWLLLGDILDLFGLTPEERVNILGPGVSALLDAVCAQTWQAITE
jgi:hypothetical protein